MDIDQQQPQREPNGPRAYGQHEPLSFASGDQNGAGGGSTGSQQSGIPSEVPENIPGGPYQPKPPTPGNRPGSFQGPRQPSGPRPQVEWVPPEGEGGPPGSSG